MRLITYVLSMFRARYAKRPLRERIVSTVTSKQVHMGNNTRKRRPISSSPTPSRKAKIQRNENDPQQRDWTEKAGPSEKHRGRVGGGGDSSGDNSDDMNTSDESSDIGHDQDTDHNEGHLAASADENNEEVDNQANEAVDDIFAEDPKEMPDDEEEEEEEEDEDEDDVRYSRLYWQHWAAIRSHHKHDKVGHRPQDTYHFRVGSGVQAGRGQHGAGSSVVERRIQPSYI